MKEFTNPLYEGTFFDSKYNGLFFAGDTTLKMTGNSAPIPQPAWPLGPCDLWRDYWCRYQNNKNTKSTSQLEIQAVQDSFRWRVPTLFVTKSKTKISNLSPAIKNFAKKCNSWPIRDVESSRKYFIDKNISSSFHFQVQNN